MTSNLLLVASFLTAARSPPSPRFEDVSRVLPGLPIENATPVDCFTDKHGITIVPFDGGTASFQADDHRTRSAWLKTLERGVFMHGKPPEVIVVKKWDDLLTAEECELLATAVR